MAEHSKVCVACGTWFGADGKRSRRDTCSNACRRLWEAMLRRVNRKKRRKLGLYCDGTPKQRAEHYGVAYEPIDNQRVYERDGWRCQLCQTPINRSAKAPDPFSATIDHAIPVSKGGPHTYANVQAAHFACNTAKGARYTGARTQLIDAA